MAKLREWANERANELPVDRSLAQGAWRPLYSGGQLHGSKRGSTIFPGNVGTLAREPRRIAVHHRSLGVWYEAVSCAPCDLSLRMTEIR